jgi:Arc/MetJ family transcription regulator
LAHDLLILRRSRAGIHVGKDTVRRGALISSHGSPPVIFKGVRDGKPYPEHGLSYKQWSQIPPRQIRLDELVTTTTVLALDRLLSEDSTFYGDLFPHAVRWQGVIYLEDGLHRAVRAALRNRTVLHARVHDMDDVPA